MGDASDLKVKDQLVINSTPECTAQLLALAVDHIDILLEDWYPTLGTRFVHTSEGKFLITRLVPCPQCLSKSMECDQSLNPIDFSQPKNLMEEMQQAEQEGGYHNQHHNRVRKSQESYTSECDSGVGPDSSCSSRMPSMEGHPGVQTDEQPSNVSYSWMVEECILAAYGSKTVNCPTHDDIPLSRVAPDAVSQHFLHLLLYLTMLLFTDIHGLGREIHYKTRKH